MNIEPTSVLVDGRPVRGVVVTCKCGVIKQIPVNSVHRPPGDQEAVRDAIVARRLETDGWKVLKRKDGHSCPGCVSRHEQRASSVTIIKDFKEMAAMSTVPVRPSQEPVAELTRENRRIILAKLEEVYVDEKTGYSPGWTDAKVATDLGIPRAWVKTLREDNFGPEGNEDIRIALAEAKAVLADIKVAMADVLKRSTVLAELQRRADKIERTIIEIEKGLRA